MTIFDADTDRYLERLGTAPVRGDWDDVLERTHRSRRRSRLTRGGIAGVAVTAAVAVAVVGALGGGGTSIVDKAEAAALAPVAVAPGTIEHILIQYRADSGATFIEHETWLADDGAWCRRTVEGTAGEPVAVTRLTQCGSPDGAYEVYLPSENEILRLRPGAADPEQPAREDAAVEGPSYVKVKLREDGTYYRVGPVKTAAEAPPLEIPSASWFAEDVVEAFRRDAVREAGTTTLDGREYVRLETEDGRNAVLVDPETGEPVAWIPSPEAFGTPTTVIRTRETLPDDTETRRNLSLTELYPNAAVRDVSAAELARAIEDQYPRG